MIAYGSVCSGIEAATVAWHRLGWKPVFFSEIEPFPRAVLAHHWPETPCHGDFTTIESGEYAPIDLLVGGTPCQAFSVAGLRGGLSDQRGNLTLEYLRLAERLRPRWLVWENVPGVFSALSHDAPDPCPPGDDLDGHDGPQDGQEVVVADEYEADESHAFGCFLAGLQELGYGFAYRVLDAQYSGVPQRRRRVFVVGYLGDWRCAAAVLLELHSLSGNSPPSREAGERAAASLTASSGGVSQKDDIDGRVVPLGLGDDGQIARALNACHTSSGRHDVSVDTFVAGPLLGGGRREGGYSHDDIPMVAHALRAEGFDASEDGTGRGTPLVPVRAPAGQPRFSCSVCGLSFDDEYASGVGGLAPAECPRCGDEQAVVDPLCFNSREDPDVSGAIAGPLSASLPQSQAICFSSKDHGADAEWDLAPTLRAGGHSESHANAGVPPAIAFALRGREQGAVPEIEGDGSVAGALRAASGGSSRDYVAQAEAYNFEHGLAPHGSLAASDVVPALSESEHKGHTAIHVASAVRRLTPTECERLQGFPDGHTAIPFRGKVAADGPRYKALGNSMAVPVMQRIGEAIQAVEDLIATFGLPLPPVQGPQPPPVFEEHVRDWRADEDAWDDHIDRGGFDL